MYEPIYVYIYIYVYVYTESALHSTAPSPVGLEVSPKFGMCCKIGMGVGFYGSLKGRFEVLSWSLYMRIRVSWGSC